MKLYRGHGVDILFILLYQHLPPRFLQNQDLAKLNDYLRSHLIRGCCPKFWFSYFCAFVCAYLFVKMNRTSYLKDSKLNVDYSHYLLNAEFFFMNSIMNWLCYHCARVSTSVSILRSSLTTQVHKFEEWRDFNFFLIIVRACPLS
jgi:hypothetical protein